MRRPNIIRPVKVHTALPEDLWAKIQFHLHSPVEGRVPKGAFQALMIRLLTDYLNLKENGNATEPRSGESNLAPADESNRGDNHP